MADERYPRDTDRQDDYYGRQGSRDQGRDEGYSSARDYRSAGDLGGYGQREESQRYGQRDQGGQRYGQSGQSNQGSGNWGDQDRQRQGITGGPNYYRSDDGQRQGRQDERGQGRDTSDRQPQRPDDRGFMQRAGDEVRSWFGDEHAEQRRERDARENERGAGARDDHYHSWRDQQIAAFDRDYHEYRQENQSKFHNEFSSWRTERQAQRDLLGKVDEHMDVVGSDGQHIGTVDKVRGDRIILTKSDADAGGRHHSFPSRWLQSVNEKLTLSKTADEAKRHWRDEERGGALFGEDKQSNEGGQDSSGTNLNRSFSGTY